MFSSRRKVLLSMSMHGSGKYRPQLFSIQLKPTNKRIDQTLTAEAEYFTKHRLLVDRIAYKRIHEALIFYRQYRA